MTINSAAPAGRVLTLTLLYFRFIIHISIVPQKPPVLVLSMAEALVVISLSSEQLFVVKYAVELPM